MVNGIGTTAAICTGVLSGYCAHRRFRQQQHAQVHDYEDDKKPFALSTPCSLAQSSFCNILYETPEGALRPSTCDYASDEQQQTWNDDDEDVLQNGKEKKKNENVTSSSSETNKNNKNGGDKAENWFKGKPTASPSQRRLLTSLGLAVYEPDNWYLLSQEVKPFSAMAKARYVPMFAKKFKPLTTTDTTSNCCGGGKKDDSNRTSNNFSCELQYIAEKCSPCENRKESNNATRNVIDAVRQYCEGCVRKLSSAHTPNTSFISVHVISSRPYDDGTKKKRKETRGSCSSKWVMEYIVESRERVASVKPEKTASGDDEKNSSSALLTRCISVTQKWGSFYYTVLGCGRTRCCDNRNREEENNSAAAKTTQSHLAFPSELSPYWSEVENVTLQCAEAMGIAHHSGDPSLQQILKENMTITKEGNEEMMKGNSYSFPTAEMITQVINAGGCATKLKVSFSDGFFSVLWPLNGGSVRFGVCKDGGSPAVFRGKEARKCASDFFSLNCCTFPSSSSVIEDEISSCFSFAATMPLWEETPATTTTSSLCFRALKDTCDSNGFAKCQAVSVKERRTHAATEKGDEEKEKKEEKGKTCLPSPNAIHCNVLVAALKMKNSSCSGTESSTQKMSNSFDHCDRTNTSTASLSVLQKVQHSVHLLLERVGIPHALVVPALKRDMSRSSDKIKSEEQQEEGVMIRDECNNNSNEISSYFPGPVCTYSILRKRKDPTDTSASPMQAPAAATTTQSTAVAEKKDFIKGEIEEESHSYSWIEVGRCIAFLPRLGCSTIPLIIWTCDHHDEWSSACSASQLKAWLNQTFLSDTSLGVTCQVHPIHSLPDDVKACTDAAVRSSSPVKKDAPGSGKKQTTGSNSGDLVGVDASSRDSIHLVYEPARIQVSLPILPFSSSSSMPNKEKETMPATTSREQQQQWTITQGSSYALDSDGGGELDWVADISVLNDGTATLRATDVKKVSTAEISLLVSREVFCTSTGSLASWPHCSDFALVNPHLFPDNVHSELTPGNALQDVIAGTARWDVHVASIRTNEAISEKKEEGAKTKETQAPTTPENFDDVIVHISEPSNETTTEQKKGNLTAADRLKRQVDIKQFPLRSRVMQIVRNYDAAMVKNVKLGVSSIAPSPSW